MYGAKEILGTAKSRLSRVHQGDSLHGQSTDVSFAIVMSGIAAMNFYQFYQFRYKTALGAGVLVTVAVISVVVHHIFATM